MAIIRSIAIGKSRKSMGNVTFRVVRGRTIGSEKVAPRPLTRAEDVTLQQFVFGLVTRYMALHAADIMVSFNRTKYGSERNYFAKVNFQALKRAFNALYSAGATSVDEISDAQIENAVASYAEGNPSAIYRVKRSGYPVVYLSGEWSSDENPEEVNPALRVSLTAIQAEDGGAYNGSAQTIYLAGSNLDKITSVAVRVTEEGGLSESSASVSSFQLQSDGRLKVVFNYTFGSPLDTDFAKIVVSTTPSASITWSASGSDEELDPLG